ncbi:flagellar basal-body rod protein FlgC [Halomonas elongata]|uniref:Flagellar basal-body rod protein FlgC n=1 Tax=Halomonas elongata TaxID=2746 RepID=A0A1B8NZF6_HALEL|nr:flagellar basal-body rod protein FlgC [Halomonas elongata]
MSMFSVFEISGSAMSAQSQRMNVTASNLANADSVAGPDGEAYRAKQVLFETRAQSRTGVGGVGVREVVEDPSPMRRQYRPSIRWPTIRAMWTCPTSIRRRRWST